MIFCNSLKVSEVFFSTRENGELLPKFHVALHASHILLPILTRKFCPSVVFLCDNTRNTPYAVLTMLIYESRILFEYTGNLLNFGPWSSFHLYLLHFFTSSLLHFLPSLQTSLCEDERTLTGDLRNCKFSSVSLLIIAYNTSPSRQFLFSLTLNC
jgi:hypothetical protein